MYRTVFVLCLYFLAVWTKNEIYEGHLLYNIVVENEEQAKLVNGLENQIPIDIWMYAMPGRPGQILVSKEDRRQFVDAVENAGIAYTVLTENIRESLELEEEMMSTASRRYNRSSSSRLDFNYIHRYDEVDQYLVDLANRFPNLVRVVSGGRSLEGRDIKYIRISTTDFQNNAKPIVMLQSLLHAREWITLPAALYAIEKLVVDITEWDLVDNMDWIILPIANPDGYEYSHTDARFWRKNRRLVPGSNCMGVDNNRNFDIFWGAHSSNDVCTEVFHGAAPFSEPENVVIRDIILEHSNRLQLYIDIHSHGSMILFGFGNGQLPPNGLLLNLIGVTMAQAIDRVKWDEKPNYIVGNIVAILYLASGVSSDWAQIAGTTFAYIYELPSYRSQGGLNGFLVDSDFIEQAGYETWEGIKAGARQAATLFHSRMAEKEAMLR